MPVVKGMHFVCKEDDHIVDHNDGTFDTGYWKVAREHCMNVKYVALHRARDLPSYRQGAVLTARQEDYEGEPRIVFTVYDDEKPREWKGGGSAEKGYLWSDEE